MNKLEKMRLFLASCMLGMAVSIVSCSSENGENDILDGKGIIRLGMSTGVDFGVTTTRSVNLADYQDKNNYTVQILKSDGTTPVQEFTYADMPSIPLELDNVESLLWNGKSFFQKWIPCGRCRYIFRTKQ